MNLTVVTRIIVSCGRGAVPTTSLNSCFREFRRQMVIKQIPPPPPQQTSASKWPCQKVNFFFNQIITLIIKHKKWRPVQMEPFLF